MYLYGAGSTVLISNVLNVGISGKINKWPDGVQNKYRVFNNKNRLTQMQLNIMYEEETRLVTIFLTQKLA